MKTYLLIVVGFFTLAILPGCTTTQCSTDERQTCHDRGCSQARVKNNYECADIACKYSGYSCSDLAQCCRVFGNVGGAWNSDTDEDQDQDDTDYSDVAPESAFSSDSIHVQTPPPYKIRPIHYKGEG